MEVQNEGNGKDCPEKSIKKKLFPKKWNTDTSRNTSIYIFFNPISRGTD